MIPIKNGLVSEQSGVVENASFHAKAKNLSIIFHILRNQLYSDKPRAVVREYSTNAMDAHISVGKPTLPIQVTLPTAIDSFLKIRDFGRGLTNEEVKDIYTSYGESTKRNDADQNGMLGIGCKSGFCYADSFIINSYKDGKLNAWTATLDDKNDGKMALMAGNVDTDEPSGIEILVPIKGGDVSLFREKAIEIYSYFEVLPNITNLGSEERAVLDANRNRNPLFSGKDGTWQFVGGSSQSVAIMTNVAYPINPDVFSDLELSPETKQLLQGGIILKFKNGEIEFSASRESLDYTPFTKKKIASKLNDVTNEIIKDAKDRFNGCKTMWEAKQMWSEVFNYTGSLYHMRHLFNKALTYNGVPLNSNRFATNGMKDGSVSNILYSKRTGYEKVHRTDIWEIEASPRNLVVINDTGITNGIINRVVGLLESRKYDKVYVLKFASHSATLTDDALRKAWQKDTAFDGPSVSLATLPKEALSKYYPNLASAANTFVSKKHISKEFTFDPLDSRGNKRSRYSARSEFWKTEDVDVDKDDGVYLEIERFEYKDKSGYHHHPADLYQFMEKLKTVGINLPAKLLGLKASSATSAKKNPKMMTFWDWLIKESKDYFTTHPEVNQDFANRDYTLNVLGPRHRYLHETALTISKWKAVKNNAELHSFCEKIKKLYKFNINNLTNIQEVLNMSGAKHTAQPSFVIHDDYDKLAKRYPLLFKIAEQVGHYYLESKGWNEHLEEYIILMDMVNPAQAATPPSVAPVTESSGATVPSGASGLLSSTVSPTPLNV